MWGRWKILVNEFDRERGIKRETEREWSECCGRREVLSDICCCSHGCVCT